MSDSAEDGNLALVEHEARRERRHDDRDAGPAVGGRRDHRRGPPRRPARRRGGRRPAALDVHSTTEYPSADERDQLAGQATGVAGHRPSPRPATLGTSGPRRPAAARAPAPPVCASSRSKATCRRGSADPVGVPGPPGGGQRLGERALLVVDLDGPVAQAPRLGRARPGRSDRARSVSSDSPSASHGSHASMPSKSSPSASRSHWPRLNVPVADSPLGPGPHRLGRAPSRGTRR